MGPKLPPDAATMDRSNPTPFPRRSVAGARVLRDAVNRALRLPMRADTGRAYSRALRLADREGWEPWDGAAICSFVVRRPDLLALARRVGWSPPMRPQKHLPHSDAAHWDIVFAMAVDGMVEK